MRSSSRWIVAAVAAAGLALTGCTGSSSEPASAGVEPATVVKVAGSELSTVTITEDAARRLDLKTVAIGQTLVGKEQRLVVPYSSVLYDPSGQAWVYTASGPLAFVREKITVDRIAGDQAVLAAGPAVGTTVVSVGGPELYGAELGVGH